MGFWYLASFGEEKISLVKIRNFTFLNVLQGAKKGGLALSPVLEISPLDHESWAIMSFPPRSRTFGRARQAIIYRKIVAFFLPQGVRFPLLICEG